MKEININVFLYKSNFISKKKLEVKTKLYYIIIVINI